MKHHFKRNRDKFPIPDGDYTENGEWRSRQHTFHASRWDVIKDAKPVSPEKPRQERQGILHGFLLFGKHRGEYIEHVPTNYLEWMLDQDGLLDERELIVVRQELFGRSDASD